MLFDRASLRRIMPDAHSSYALFAVLIIAFVCVGEHLAASDMCSIDNNPAKRAKVDAAPVVDARPTNGYRSYNSIVYPAAEAFVGSPAPQFTAPGTTHPRYLAHVLLSSLLLTRTCKQLLLNWL